LKSTVIPDVIKVIQSTVTDTINKDINRDIYQYGTHVTVPELGWVTADYAQMKVNAQVDAVSAFEMTVNGTFYNQNHTVASKYHGPVAFNAQEAGGRALQFHLTEWTLNTALEANFDGRLPQNITYLLKEVFNFTLNTTFMGTVIPQLVTKYGEGKTVELSAILFNQPSFFKLTPGTVRAEGWLAVTGTVEGSDAFYGQFSDA